MLTLGPLLGAPISAFALRHIAFLALYPASDIRESMMTTTRDAMYGWPAERLARTQRAAGAPAFLYLFDHGYPAADEAGFHAFHGAELPYVFGTSGSLPAWWPAIPDTAPTAPTWPSRRRPSRAQARRTATP